MTQPDRPEIPSWMLFAIPAAIAGSIVTGILLAGPVLGFLVAAVVALAIVGVAIRMGPGRRTAQSAEPPDRAWRGAAARRALVPLVVAAAGIVLIAVGGEIVRIIGWGTLAVAITLAISLAFLEIGYGEDRARARRRPESRPR